MMNVRDMPALTKNQSRELSEALAPITADADPSQAVASLVDAINTILTGAERTPKNAAVDVGAALREARLISATKLSEQAWIQRYVAGARGVQLSDCQSEKYYRCCLKLDTMRRQLEPSVWATLFDRLEAWSLFDLAEPRGFKAIEYVLDRLRLRNGRITRKMVQGWISAAVPKVTTGRPKGSKAKRPEIVYAADNLAGLDKVVRLSDYRHGQPVTVRSTVTIDSLKDNLEALARFLKAGDVNARAIVAELAEIAANTDLKAAA